MQIPVQAGSTQRDVSLTLHGGLGGSSPPLGLWQDFAVTVKPLA